MRFLLFALYLLLPAASAQQANTRAERFFEVAPFDDRVPILVKGITEGEVTRSLDDARQALSARLDARFSPADWATVEAFADSETARALNEAELRYYALSAGEQDSWSVESLGRTSRLSAARRALVERLAAAQWQSGLDLELAQRTLARVDSLAPDFHAALFASGMAAQLLSTTREPTPLPDDQTDFIDTFLEGIGDAELLYVVEFYESAAGVALVDAYYDAGIDLASQWYADMLIYSWENRPVQADSDGRPQPERVKDDDMVFDVVEHSPELIGGLEKLQRQVAYPVEARDAGIQGRVFVQFVVDETGRVVDAVVTRSPHDLLSEAALAAVRAARFKPGSHRGRPVKVRFMLPINFALN